MSIKVLNYLPLIGLLLFSSCGEKKDGGQESETQSEEIVQKDVPFTVTVNVVANKDDVFQVYYNEDGTDIFVAEQAITLEFKGSDKPQDLVFSFDSVLKPLALRFDIGANKEMNNVKINNFKIEYKDKVVNISGLDFNKYFVPNDQVTYDSALNTANITASAEYYDPIFVPNQAQKDLLAKLYTEEK